MLGTVAWFNVEKAYGFIKPDDGSKDLFIHFSGIAKSENTKKLLKDQRVEFSISENEKGRIAVNVRVLIDTPKIEVAK